VKHQIRLPKNTNHIRRKTRKSVLMQFHIKPANGILSMCICFRSAKPFRRKSTSQAQSIPNFHNKEVRCKTNHRLQAESKLAQIIFVSWNSRVGRLGVELLSKIDKKRWRQIK